MMTTCPILKACRQLAHPKGQGSCDYFCYIGCLRVASSTSSKLILHKTRHELESWRHKKIMGDFQGRAIVFGNSAILVWYHLLSWASTRR